MTTTQSGSQIVINQRSKATLHTFVAAENSFQVTSQIIETANGLVVVDAQFIPSLAEEVRDYAKQLGKPILRLFISHAHPDHFSGTKVFGQVPVYASQTTRDFIQAAGQAAIDQYKLGTEAVVPNHLVQPGEEVIDGLRYQYRLIQNAEAEEHLLILLPELGVIVAQDLIFNGVHLYLGTRQFATWRKAVEELRGLTDYDLILAGHGLPASPEVYAEVNAYLEDAQRAFVGNPTAQSVKESLEKAFPDLGLVGLLHLGVDNAFARSA